MQTSYGNCSRKLSKHNNKDRSEWIELSANKAYGPPSYFEELAIIFFFKCSASKAYLVGISS